MKEKKPSAADRHVLANPHEWPDGMRQTETGFEWVNPLTGKPKDVGHAPWLAFSRCLEANMNLEAKTKAATGVVAAGRGADALEGIVANAIPIEQAWCGVYFLLRGRTVVYVGMSNNVGGRLREHKRDNVKAFDMFSFMPCSLAEAQELEEFYIQSLRPEYNIKDNPDAPRKPKYQPTKRERFYRAQAAIKSA